MKIAIIWKWWAWKTTLSVLLIQALLQHKKVLAIDCDANKNLIDYLWFEKNSQIKELWDLKKEIFEITGVAKSEYERKYFPKNEIWVFDLQDSLTSQALYKNGNLSLIELGSPKEKRIWVTWMCPYNETIKVYLSNLNENPEDIVWCDFAAGSEAAGKWIITSVDHIIIPVEPNSKNLDVAKDIYKTLKHIEFENIIFIANKVTKDEDLKYIEEYFWEKISFLGIIPFSKEIMKADILWELSFENLSTELKNIFQDLAQNISSLEANRLKVLQRVKKLDILKWDTHCH